jgi:CHAT domain-containing protein
MTFPNARSPLYRYLLGESADEENRQVEERSLADACYRERLEETEHELIAAYVSGDLTIEKRERFETHFLRSEQRFEKLRLAELLHEYARTELNKLPAASDDPCRYLLGELPPDEELKIRERLGADDDYKKRLVSAEHELIAAYTLENLSEARRESFERYFFASEEKKEKLRFAETVYEYYQYVDWIEVPEGGGSRWFTRFRGWLVEPVNLSIGYRNISRPIWQPMAAVSVLGAGALVWASFFHQAVITKGLNALHAAYAQERPVEARLTGFGYAKYPASQNGNIGASDRHKRDEAFSLIINQVSEKESPEAYHALGNLYLTDKDFNGAIKCFETALKSNQDDAKLHNDLAVALMEREKAKAKNPGQSTGEDTALALEHLHRAIEMDGSLLDAQFNLALCHQYQTLWRTAEEDWKSYLEKDSASSWAEEARNNLTKVTEKIKQAGGNRENIYQNFMEAYRERDAEQAWGAYKQSRLATGSFITNRLIDNYLSLALSSKSADAQDNLSALLFIGNIEMERVKDRFTYDLAQSYRGASTQQISKLAVARRLTATANDRLRQSQVEEAINHYRQAIELFNQAGNLSESLLARRWLGYCYFRQASVALSLPVLMQGRQECEARSYLRLLGLFLNDLANVNASLARYSRALDYSLSQVGYAKRIEDDYGTVFAIIRVTEAYTLLARYQDTLPMVREGLSIASSINVGPEPLVGLYLFASKSHMASGKLMAALDYAKEAFKLSLETKNPWLVSRHYVHLGLAYHKLNNHSEAVKLIRESGEIGKGLGDGKMGREIMAFSQLHLGEIYRESGDLDNAMKGYGEALRLYDESDINTQWPRFEAKKGMLLAHIKAGDDAATEEELKQVLDLYEQHRQSIEDENSRNNFFDNEQGIYDIAIEYAYLKRQDPRRAFDFSEISRARSLLDAVDLPRRKLLNENLPNIRFSGSTQPLDLGQIQSRLPGKTQLLQYSVLDNRLIIWVISGADFRSYSVEVGKESLDEKISSYLRAFASGPNAALEGDYRVRSSELYNLLIKPVESLLDKNAEICIIPDKAINRVPFASLISPDTGKYLIEEHAILTSPSANMFLVASDKARQKESIQTERLLSVGNPWFDRDAFRDLKDLPWAATQASEISAFYQASTVLLEKNARELSVRRELEKTDVAHFATHYVADERSPMLSVLPLAWERNPASKESDGVLQTFEFYDMNLSRLRLVVLSACQTGIERYYKGEGVIGLARPFQSAGIPLVMASLWPVESYPTKELMIALHKHRKSDGLSTAQALRQAQLDMIRSGSPEFRNPYHWAAYTIIGGHANF